MGSWVMTNTIRGGEIARPLKIIFRVDLLKFKEVFYYAKKVTNDNKTDDIACSSYCNGNHHEKFLIN